MARIAYHPLGPGSWPITSPWRPAHRPGHRGADVGVWKKPLYASVSGIATTGSEPGGAGWWVNIAGDNGVLVKTFHMSRVDVSNGERVTAGQTIGISGGVPGEPGAGNTTGAHLHYEIWEGGRDTDPVPDLQAVAAFVADIVDTVDQTQEDEMTPEQMAELKKHIDDRLEQVANADRAHMAAIRDQGVASVASVIAAAAASDETTDTRLRDELAALVRALDDAAKDRGA